MKIQYGDDEGSTVGFMTRTQYPDLYKGFNIVSL